MSEGAPSSLATSLSAWQIERTPRDPHLLPSSLGSLRRIPAIRRGQALYGDRAFNPGWLPAADGPPVEQLIVTSAALEADFQVLADRETKRGIPTVVRTLAWIDSNYSGADQPSRIRTFLRDAYDRWGTEFVILGGDLEIVPTRYIRWDEEEIPTDMYYACVDREWNEDGDGVYAEPMTAASFDGLVNSVAVDGAGDVWLATYFGLARLSGGTFQTWDERDGLPSPTIRAVDVAPDGTVWVAAQGGVSCFDGVAWQHFGVSTGMAGNDAYSVHAISNTEVWVGTNAGVEHFGSGTWSQWGLAEGVPAVPVTDLTLDGATVWLGTAAGAAKLDGGVVTVYNTANSGILSNWVISVAVDDQGRPWFGHADNYFTQGGLSRLDGGTWFTDDLPAWGGLSVRSLSIGPGGDEVWAATAMGLFHRTPAGDELYDSNDGLAATDCYATAFTAGGLAIGTAAGLSTGSPTIWNVYTTDDGIPAAIVDYDDVDLVPDLSVGRIPAASSAEVAIYLQKLIDYQDGILVDHVEKTLFLGENMFAPGDGKDLCVSVRDRLPGSFVHQELYEVDGTENPASVVAGLNSGPAWVIDVGHGSYDAMGVGAGLDLLFNSDVAGVDAGGRSGFLMVYSCNSGAFDLESSSEAFLFNPNGGSIAVVANTREAVPTIDADLNEEFFDRLLTSSHGSPAQTIRELWTARVSTDPTDYRKLSWWRRTFLSRTYQGSPTLALWRGAPGALNVTHPSSAPLSRTPFPVHVEDAVTATPIEGALVCVSKGTEDYAYGRTDAAGDVTFQFRPESVGTMDVIVSTADHVPYSGAAVVNASVAPNPVADGWQTTAARRSSGNDLEIMLAVRNAGLNSAAGWVLQLVSEDPNVTVVSGTGGLPPMAAGETIWAGPFTLSVGSGLDSRDTFQVRLDGTGEVMFAEPYTLTVEASDLHLEALDLTTSEIRPVVSNLGSVSTGPLTGTLTALDAAGTVLDGTGTAAAVGVGQSVTFADGFLVSGPPAARFELSIVDAFGREFLYPIDREAPDPAWQVKSEPRTDGALLTWDPSDAGDVIGYLVEGFSSGSWVDEFGALVKQGAMAHVALPAGTSKEFRVTAVDAAGNRAPAAQVTAHSALPLLPGWPRRISALIGPAPMVLSDLDGDDSPEVLVGSMWETNSVHVFRTDGSEWTDGDSNSTTLGVFGETDGRIHTATLTLDIDDDGHREIFAASLDGYLYGWRSDGTGGAAPTDLPGWPVLCTPTGVRGTPVAADLDGDLEPEIVCIGNDGAMRAFHTDGTVVAGWPYLTSGYGAGCTPAVFDLNLDGLDDVVFGGTDSTLCAVSGDGTDLPGWPVSVGERVLSSPVLADIDGDGDFEIFVHTKMGDVFGFHHDAAPVTGWPVRIQRYDFTPPSPAVADFDRDGVPEIVVAGGHELVVFRADGSFYPGFPLQLAYDVVNSPVVADLNGDLSLDILIGTMDRRLWAFDVDGSVLPGWPAVLNERPWSTPYVQDVDLDGDLDVVFGGDDMYIRILDAAGPASAAAAPWPGYHGGSQRNGVYVAPPPATDLPADLLPGPTRLEIHHAAPNPFRGSTELRFALPQAGQVWLEVFDVAGRRVAAPVAGVRLPAGAHQVAWDGRDGRGRSAANGVYFLRLRAAGEVRTGRVVRLR